MISASQVGSVSPSRGGTGSGVGGEDELRGMISSPSITDKEASGLVWCDRRGIVRRASVIVPMELARESVHPTAEDELRRVSGARRRPVCGRAPAPG